MAGTPEAERPPGLRPEAELLLWCVRICDEPERAEHIRKLVRKSIDWELLLRLAAHNRLYSLVYWHLNAASPESVPPPVLDSLRAIFHQTAVQNLFQTQELIELLELFESHGIRALPYKGPLLAISLYGNLGLRHFWDLDILVRREDVLKVKELVLARGYEAERKMSREEELAHLESDCELNFDGHGGRVHLEIHWDILPKPFASRMDPDYVWGCAVPVPLVNTTALTLPPEELILILCLHGGDKHHWVRLKWINDIALFAARNGVDWRRVMQEADRLGRRESVLLGLHLARILLGAPLPAEVRDKMSHNWKRSAEAGLVRGRLFRDNFGLPGFKEWLSYLNAETDSPRVNGSALRRWRDRVRYIRAVLRPEYRDRYTLSFPPGLSFLAYVYRILRLAKSHRKNLISRLR